MAGQAGQRESEGHTVERRNGRIYLSGLAVSLLGDSAMILVAAIWVKALTGSGKAAPVR